MKSYIFSILGVILVLSISVLAEEPPAQRWVARYNGPGDDDDGAYALAIDNSGNVYVTGESISSSTYYDYATIKYDPNGKQLWVARYNGPGDDEDGAYALAIDSLGNVYVTGYSYSSSTYYDYATIKYDPNSKQLWVRRYDGPENDDDGASALAIDNSGNVYVTGYSYSSSTYYDYATIKYGPTGNQLWVKRYNGPGNDDDGAYALAIDNSGNVYVTGASYSSTSYDYATIKYGPTGNQLWVKRYNGPGDDYDGAYALAIDNSGNVYVTGDSYGSGTGYDYATIKYGPTGNQLWAARYNGPRNNDDSAYALAIDNSGNVYVTGDSGYSESSSTYTYCDYATIKYDPTGKQSWVARYNGPGNDDDGASALAIDNSGNVYVTGYSYSSSTYYDYATIKYDPNGNQLWVACFNNLENLGDGAYALAVDNSGNVYVTGDSEGSATWLDYATIKYTQHGYCLGAIDGDLDGDCKVDFADFAMLAEDWLESTYLADLAELAEDWLECNFALQEDCF